MDSPTIPTGNGWEACKCGIGEARGKPRHNFSYNEAEKRCVCTVCDLDVSVDDWREIECRETPPLNRHETGATRERPETEGTSSPSPEVSFSGPLKPLEELPEEPTPEALYRAVRAFAAKVRDVTPLERETAREAALRALKEKASAPARLLDAALGSGKESTRGGDLQGQAAALEPPEPWPEPVAGAALLSELQTTFERFLVLPAGAAVAFSLWVVFAHAHDAAEVSPLLVLVSPEKRCGKTTALSLLGALVPTGLHTSSITPAALFRGVELFGPTLLIDEADSFLKMREELRGILNSGHTRSGARILRAVGDNHEPRWFSTWAPKAVALIGSLPSTLEDRSILVPMRRKTSGEKVERLRQDRLGSETQTLRSKAARWALDHLEMLRSIDPETPKELHDRAADNWRPLLAIAELAGGSWPETARRAARVLSAGATAEDSSMGVTLLGDLREIFEQAGTDRLFTSDILRELQHREERPWCEWGRSEKPITARGVAKLLKPFGVQPRQIRIEEATAKGYRREDLEDAFSRYLPPSEAKHPKQTKNGAGFRDSSIRNTGSLVSAGKSPESPVSTGDVSDVSDEDQGAAWEDV